MIKLTDTTILAFTKLRTRKFRTIVTVLLASMLFSILIAGSLVMTGALRSVDAFRNDGLTSRYIVGVYESMESDNIQDITRNPDLIAKAKAKYETLVAKKTAEAKRLDIPYTQASDQPPYTLASGDSKEEMLAFRDSNGIVHEVLAEKFSKEPAFNATLFDTLTAKYHAIDTFTARSYLPAQNGSLSVLPKDGEKFLDQADESQARANEEVPTLDPSFIVTPPQITDVFLLPNNADWTPESNTLPVVLPQDSIERLLGFEKLPSSATAKQKLDRLKDVRAKASSLSFQACYRNSASQALIQKTIQQQAYIKAHSKDKDYQAESLTYALPDPQSCKEPTIAKDTRTAEEKTIDSNQELFNKEFSTEPDPVSYFVQFKVVGVSPATIDVEQMTSIQNRTATDIIGSLLTSNSLGQVIPENLYDKIPDKKKYSDILAFTPTYLFGNEENIAHFVEFKNAHDAEKFIDEQSCTTQYDGTCKPKGRPYQASLEFSNSAAIEDLRQKTTQVFEIASIVVIILAAIIMWIAVGRTITDGRHETAVFRAIGFKRIDIAAVYVLYAGLLSLFVALFAAGIGIATAYAIDYTFGPQFTALAQYGFGGVNLDRTFSLFGIDYIQLGFILAACLVTGILSTFVPLLRNVRRNPINDMREE